MTREKHLLLPPKLRQNAYFEQNIETVDDTQDNAEANEPSMRFAHERIGNSGISSVPNELVRDREKESWEKQRDRQPKRSERPIKAKELLGVFNLEDEDTPKQNNFSANADDNVLRSADRLTGAGRKRKSMQNNEDFGSLTGERYRRDSDPNDDNNFNGLTPKAFQSNSFTTPELESQDNQDDTEVLRQGSMKSATRMLNAAKFVFNRETKSKSISQKTSRSANVKLTPGPANASIKKLLQNPPSKLLLSSTSTSTSATKNSDSGEPTFSKPLTLNASNASESRQLTDQPQALSFRKPGREQLFSRVNKPSLPNVNTNYGSGEDRGSGSNRGD